VKACKYHRSRLNGFWQLRGRNGCEREFPPLLRDLLCSNSICKPVEIQVRKPEEVLQIRVGRASVNRKNGDGKS